MFMRLLTPLACAAMLTGCVTQANSSGSHNPHDDEPRGTACVPAGTWLDPQSRQEITIRQLLSYIEIKDIVLLGETHTAADHHRWHVQIVAQLYAQRPDMVLGFEAFPRRVQGALDRWVAGELSEKEFLEQSDWETVWRYDPKHYLPVFHFARMNAIPMMALNVDRSLIREVSENGWEAVPEDKRRGVGDPAPATSAYLDMLAKIYSHHEDDNGKENGPPKKPGREDPMFSNFVDAQLTWDRAMAEAAQTALKPGREAGSDPRIVAIIGRGHMDHFRGVPEQLKDLGETSFAVLTPWDSLRKCEDLVSDGVPAADAVFGIGDTPDMFASDNKQKLGVMIEPHGDGVRIGAVLDDSIAEKSGLKKDDVIVEAAGTPTRNTGDLVTVIKAMNPGTWLPLSVLRGDDTLEVIARFPAHPPDIKSPHGKK